MTLTCRTQGKGSPLTMPPRGAEARSPAGTNNLLDRLIQNAVYS